MIIRDLVKSLNHACAGHLCPSYVLGDGDAFLQPVEGRSPPSIPVRITDLKSGMSCVPKVCTSCSGSIVLPAIIEGPFCGSS